MYDYLAKVILLGPSGAGKSCVLHRFVKNECTAATSDLNLLHTLISPELDSRLANTPCTYRESAIVANDRCRILLENR